MSDIYELVEYEGLHRPEYILRNGRAFNIYKAKEVLEEQQREIAHWKANHYNVVEKLRRFTCRPDITINKQQEEINTLKARVENAENKVVFLDHQLNNAIAEIQKRPLR